MWASNSKGEVPVKVVFVVKIMEFSLMRVDNLSLGISPITPHTSSSASLYLLV